MELFVVAADGVHELDQRAGKDTGGPGHQRVAGGVHGGIVGVGLPGGLTGQGFDPVAVDGIEQSAHDMVQGLAGLFGDAGLFVGSKVFVQP